MSLEAKLERMAQEVEALRAAALKMIVREIMPSEMTDEQRRATVRSFEADADRTIYPAEADLARLVVQKITRIYGE